MEGDDIMRGGVDGCLVVGDISSCVLSERWFFLVLVLFYVSFLLGGDGIFVFMFIYVYRGVFFFWWFFVVSKGCFSYLFLIFIIIRF